MCKLKINITGIDALQPVDVIIIRLVKGAAEEDTNAVSTAKIENMYHIGTENLLNALCQYQTGD